jgi:hypothetical protein
MMKKAAHEIGEFARLFAYFAVVLVGFGVYRRLLLSRSAVDYPELGASVVGAMVLAKVVLLGDSLGLGKRLGARSPVVRTLCKSALYGVAVFVVVAIEHLLTGLFHGQSPADVWREVQRSGWQELAARAVLVFTSFVPFFALHECLSALKRSGGGASGLLAEKRNRT